MKFKIANRSNKQSNEKENNIAEVCHSDQNIFFETIKKLGVKEQYPYCLITLYTFGCLANFPVMQPRLMSLCYTKGRGLYEIF